MCTPGYRDQSPPSWDSTAQVDPCEAEEFLQKLHHEQPGLGPVRTRLDQVSREIAETGTYVHTPTELTFGARIAWRNASRCIGRLYWRSMLVRDLRGVREPQAVFTELVRHLEIAVGDRGEIADRTAHAATRRIRPVISVFAPTPPGGRPPIRLWNEQLIRYAGYRDMAGATTGDPRYVEFTRAVTALGWHGKGDRFDVLPLVIETADERPHLFDLPERAVVEVPIAHPDYPWFAELGLRWHAVPAISNMRLRIGGVDYPLAPFNGWYMGTEIGARNLADPDRYHQLPVVAARLGLDMSSETTLWRDRALVELNRAVLWSFERAGLRISDHHTESRRFLEHIAKEERAGRQTPADWSWIVPPMSGSATPVFHRYYHQADQRPNFYLDPDAQGLARYGRARQPSTVTYRPPAQVCPVSGSSGEYAAAGAVPAGSNESGREIGYDTSRRRWPFRQRPPSTKSA
jgi:nitric-oxide synthase, bacterial